MQVCGVMLRINSGAGLVGTYLQYLVTDHRIMLRMPVVNAHLGTPPRAADRSVPTQENVPPMGNYLGTYRFPPRGPGHGVGKLESP